MRYLCLFTLCAGVLHAQGFQASLRGRIVDPDGRAVAIAKISLVDDGTSILRATITNSEGEYTFAAVNPATYSVIAESPGFKKLDRRGVVVATQAAVTIDFRMELGQVTEQVNVTADVADLETANASTGTVVDRQKLLDLPNLGRNPFILSKLSESVVQNGNPKFNRMQDQSGSSSISIAGGPVRGNNYTLDGISITDSSNQAVIIPSPEAVEEVKVQANTYDAEMGRTGGGTFNTFMRSGTNQVRGSAFGYMRETPWLANNFFSNRAGTPIIEQPFRNYGGSFGGPIRIPKVYDGRNRTFFWITGEAYRQTESAGTRISVPTALERVGDFSQTLSRTGTRQLIYDPNTTTSAGVRTPFPGNVLPAERLSKIGLALASYYPAPNVKGQFYGDPNFDATVPASNRADQTTWKGDHELFHWWRASASYLHYGSQEPGNRWFSNIASPNQGILRRKVDATQLNSTFTPSSTTVISARYGFNRFPNFTSPLSQGFDLAKLGFSSAYTSLIPTPSFPSIAVDSLNSYGGAATTFSIQSSRNLNVTLSKFVGKHSIKTGFDWRTIKSDRKPTSGPSNFAFSDVFTRATPRTSTLGTGAGLASLLLGTPTSGDMTIGANFFNFIHYYGIFVQDDWRLTPKLTVNFGLRYEHETAPQDRDNNFIIGFDPAIASPLQKTVADPKIFGSLLYAGVDGNGTMAGDPLNTKFGPRAGVAYQVNSKTVIRGGYGLFWAPATFSAQSTLGYSQTTPIVASNDNNFTPSATLENPFPGGLLKAAGNSARGLAGIGQSLSVPNWKARSAGSIQQYSLDVQRQAPGGLVLSGGYIGSKSLNLAQTLNLNQLAVASLSLGAALNQSVPNPMYLNGGTLAVGSSTIARSQLLRPFPQFATISITDSDVGHAVYHALYLKASRRFAQGITVLATYTKSQNTGLGATPQNAYDPEAEYGLAATHIPSRLSIASTIELPFGKGKRLLNSNRMLDLIAGGWAVNAVGSMQSGYPLAVTQNNDNSVIGAAAMRPNATGVSPVVDKPFNERLDGYLNPAAFSIAPQFSFGNVAPRISMRGPGMVNWDVSVFKTYAVRERLKVQFRAEALNFTNTPLFGAPNTNIASPAFGKITTQTNFSRLVQLGVRFFL